MFQFELIKKKRDAEERKRFPLEVRLKQKIVGQESAIKVVASGNLVITFCLRTLEIVIL